MVYLQETVSIVFRSHTLLKRKKIQVITIVAQI
jgi:hypothetical protein